MRRHASRSLSAVDSSWPSLVPRHPHDPNISRLRPLGIFFPSFYTGSQVEVKIKWVFFAQAISTQLEIIEKITVFIEKKILSFFLSSSSSSCFLLLGFEPVIGLQLRSKGVLALFGLNQLGSRRF
ncbi:uncharacterized protein A4U43_C07F3430 [Asparagus officinalis]|uniref:Uncharacterized protein n=1 Tax=Asparagus officinalis TaxID=4686 RepID=A0A5P1E924_ASPOF|nr:uncharacterized protein A4U43_C07F3430 [Asparagus officinalis]